MCCPWAIDIVSRHIDRFKPSLVPKFEQFLLPCTFCLNIDTIFRIPGSRNVEEIFEIIIIIIIFTATRLNISEEEIPILYHLEKNFPLIVSSVYLADLFIGGVAAIFFLFVTNVLRH